MDVSVNELAAAALSLATLYALIAFGVIALARARTWSVLGEPWQVRRPVGGLRRAALVGLVLLGVAGSFLPELGAGVWLPVIAAAVLLVLQPWSTDEALGSRGLVRGWCGRRYEDLEEWRLTGDHLRARIRGEWTAVHVPLERRDELRGLLQRLVPERESVFRQ